MLNLEINIKIKLFVLYLLHRRGSIAYHSKFKNRQYHSMIFTTKRTILRHLAANSDLNVRQMTQYTKQQTDAFNIRRNLLMLSKICAQKGGEQHHELHESLSLISDCSLPAVDVYFFQQKGAMDTNSSRFTMIRGTLQMMKKNAMVNNILAFLASSRFAEMKIFRCIDVVTHILHE